MYLWNHSFYQFFTIACKERCPTYPIMIQQFNQGSLINTLLSYLHKPFLDGGPDTTKSSSWYSINNDDSDSNFDGNCTVLLQRTNITNSSISREYYPSSAVLRSFTNVTSIFMIL